MLVRSDVFMRLSTNIATSDVGVPRNADLSITLPTKTGRSLFQKNCAHCHGDDARGDEGPDLHGLKKSDEWIARRIRNGVKGEMTAFGEKFSPSELDALIAYLRSLTPPDRSTNRHGVTDTATTHQPQRFDLLSEQ